MAAELLPAIDLRGGRVVRLRKGDYGDETVYGDDPLVVAERFVDEGARWVHIVDLDAARGDGPVNRPVLSRISEALSGRARVQTGGGVRSVGDAEALAAAGVARVVMGSAAIADPELVTAVAAVVPVAVGLDHRSGRIAIQGWTEASDLSVDEALTMFPAAEAFVVTDIERDGMLSGPDITGLAAAVLSCDRPIIASGGVAGVDDVRALADIDGLGGVITGKAIYEGRLTIGEALAVLDGRR
jgi:phosphoribosylformimino-5-aminoimidazole carboxamide ribotide isomerase